MHLQRKRTALAAYRHARGKVKFISSGLIGESAITQLVVPLPPLFLPAGSSGEIGLVSPGTVNL